MTSSRRSTTTTAGRLNRRSFKTCSSDSALSSADSPLYPNLRGEVPVLWEVETDEGFRLEDLLQELGRLELKAFERVKHGDVPQEGQAP